MHTHDLSPKILASQLRDLAAGVESLAVDWMKYDNEDMATGRHGTVDWANVDKYGGPVATWVLREIAAGLYCAAAQTGDLQGLHADLWLIESRLVIVRDALYHQVSPGHWGEDGGDESYAARAEHLWDRLSVLLHKLEIVAPLPYGGPEIGPARSIPTSVTKAMDTLSEQDRGRVEALRDLAPGLSEKDRCELVEDYSRQIAYRLALLEVLLNAAEAEVPA